ncbi:MAG TPA: tyrosine-type recombinase/integrase, partial [Isosphaeraceae bacterium]|nr:tyrosine-type recombinase/integrase [Isosphaeraceae bacterium]
LVGLPRMWRRILKRAGLERVRIHDLRHTFATYGAGSGLSLPLIGGLLGHSQPATTARYAHAAFDPLREAARQAADPIAKALGLA